MTKRHIEIEDDLQERVDSLKEDLRENFITYLEENPDISDFDEYYQSQGCDTVHELADSNTPIYNKGIDDLYYLYGNEFEEAYDNAGIGNKTEDNYRQVTIYCYLSEKGFEYIGVLEDLFNEYELDENPENIKDLIKELKRN